MTEKDHFVAYLKWNVREHWKEITPRGRAGKRPYPYKFGSNQKHFPTSVTKGSILWIISSPYFEESNYRLPPTIIARLHIEKVKKGKSTKVKRLPEDYDWVAHANPSDKLSRYFSLNNAFYALTEIEFTNSQGKRRRIPKRLRNANIKNPYLHIPKFLRNVSKIAPDKVGPIKDFARKIEEKRTVFVSYSHHDKASFVRKVIKCLRREDFAPWIDLESIPQIRSEEIDSYSSELVLSILKDGIRQARLMIAFVGPEYKSRYWTRQEWELGFKTSKTRRKFDLVQVLIDRQPIPSNVPSISASTPSQTARDIRLWWEQQHDA